MKTTLILTAMLSLGSAVSAATDAKSARIKSLKHLEFSEVHGDGEEEVNFGSSFARVTVRRRGREAARFDFGAPEAVNTVGHPYRRFAARPRARNRRSGDHIFGARQGVDHAESRCAVENAACAVSRMQPTRSKFTTLPQSTRTSTSSSGFPARRSC